MVPQNGSVEEVYDNQLRAENFSEPLIGSYRWLLDYMDAATAFLMVKTVGANTRSAVVAALRNRESSAKVEPVKEDSCAVLAYTFKTGDGKTVLKTLCGPVDRVKFALAEIRELAECLKAKCEYVVYEGTGVKAVEKNGSPVIDDATMAPF